MFEVSIERAAEEELNAAAEFYEIRETGLGEGFLDEGSLCASTLDRISSIWIVLFG